MSIVRSVFLRASHSKFLAGQMSRRAFARRALRRFMPGETLDAALDAARQLAAAGIGSILTELGENLTSLAEADAVRDHYLGVYERIKERGLPSWPSVKPTQLGLDLSPEACLANLEALAAKADATGSFLWIDMEDSSYVDRTLDLFRKLRAGHANVGVCLQSYLRRTPADLDALLPLRPAIRLVKGAYAEPAHLAFPKKRDVDLAFYDLALRLLKAARDGGALPVFGTHDVPLLRRIVAHAADLEVRDGGYEIHMLYGIRMTDQHGLTAQGRKVRTLISYGEHWFPWYMRRLAERPANAWFVVKSMLG